MAKNKNNINDKHKQLLKLYDIPEQSSNHCVVNAKFDYCISVLSPVTITIEDETNNPITFFVDPMHDLLLDAKNNVINFNDRSNFNVVFLRFINAKHNWEYFKLENNEQFIQSILNNLWSNIFSISSIPNKKNKVSKHL